MNEFDFQSFLNQIKDKSWHEMIAISDERCANLERDSYRVKGAITRRENGSIELAEKIKGLIFWLGNGTKPFGLSDADFQRLRPLCEALIEKGQLKPESLEIFRV